MKTLLLAVLFAAVPAAQAAADTASYYGVTISTTQQRALMAIVGSIEVSTSVVTKDDPAIILNGKQRRLTVADDDRVNVTTMSPTGFAGVGADLLRVSSVSIGAFYSNGNIRTNLGLAAGGAGDIWVEKAGDTMAGTLNMSSYMLTSSSDVSAAHYQINGNTVLSLLPGTGSLGVGANAGSVSTGDNNSFFGFGAGYSNTTGNKNSFLGYQTGYFNTAGSENSFFSSGAGISNTTGSQNSFLGYQAGMANQIGSANTVLGYRAGSAGADWVYSFSSSTIVGYQAGFNVTTGGDNTFLGWQAGFTVKTGTGNILIGYNADAAAGTNNLLNIGGKILGNLAPNGGITLPATSSMTVLATSAISKLLIGGQPSYSAKLDVAGNISNTGIITSSGTGSYLASVNIGTNTSQAGADLHIGHNSGATNGGLMIEELYPSSARKWFITPSYVNGGMTFRDETGNRNVLTLNATGYAGIGTDTPTEKLTVAGNFVVSDNANIGWGNRSSQIHSLNGASGYMRFFTNNTEQLRIGVVDIPIGGALCKNANGELSKCTSAVNASGNCTCP